MRHKRGRLKKIRIGLKYCGGCNPTYDRVSLVNYIAEELRHEIEFMPPEGKDLGLILVIEGCEAACVDLSQFKGVPIRVITCAEMAEDVIREIRGTVASENLNSG